MTQKREMTLIHHRPTKNLSQGAESSTMAFRETTAPDKPPIWGTGWWCCKHSKTFFISALTGEDPEKRALGTAWDTWEQPAFLCGWSPVSCGLFLWHIFLKCSRSEHLMPRCKEAGQPFPNSTIISRHSRVTIIEKKWMPMIHMSRVIQSNHHNMVLFRDSLCWKNFLVQIQSGVILPLQALQALVADHRF